MARGSMKFVDTNPFANPDAVARQIIEIANGVEAVQGGRTYYVSLPSLVV
jgi:hypothetical protein